MNIQASMFKSRREQESFLAKDLARVWTCIDPHSHSARVLQGVAVKDGSI